MTDSDSPKQHALVAVHMVRILMFALVDDHIRPARSPNGENFVDDVKSWACRCCTDGV